jgi:hypothetical protein
MSPFFTFEIENRLTRIYQSSSASIITMHTVQQQNARIYLDQQYVVEEDVATNRLGRAACRRRRRWPASVWGGGGCTSSNCLQEPSAMIITSRVLKKGGEICAL